MNSRFRLSARLLLTAAFILLSQRGSTPPEASRPAHAPTPLPLLTTPSPGSANPADPAICTPDNTPPDVKTARALAARSQRTAALAKTTAFTDWLTAWRRADPAHQTALASTGHALALSRREAVKYLIETDPERALALAVPVGLRLELPPSVNALLEQHFDARGDFEVSISHLGAEARIERIARLGDKTHRAFVFGRREHQATKLDIPLHGIALDDSAALTETPYRALDDSEKSFRQLTSEQTAVFIGEALLILTDPAALETLATQLIAAESGIGPQVVAMHSGAPSRTTLPTPPSAEVTSPASWINGTKRLLWLKIDFADDPGAAFTDAEILAGGNNTSTYFAANAQDKTTFSSTILPAVLRMPKTKAYYETSGSTNTELYTATRDAAKAYDATNGGAGTWDPDKFDRYLILHKKISTYLYGGVAQLGGPRVGLNNTVGNTVSHELGHTQSLAHSHYWLPTGTSPVGAGAHVEYGDPFDVMGNSGNASHFNVSQKSKLGYLDGSAITTVTQAGTYRIARHDDKAASGIRGLKIAATELGYEYWVEHRQVAPTSFNAAQLDRFRNGVLLHWGAEKSPKFTTGQGSYLLDATPGSAAGANDAPLRIGESFVDPDAGITIKPIAVGGAAPNEYIDVQIAFGATDGNRNPVLLASAPNGPLAARTNILFSASATDPDNDPISFRWDFGDGALLPNLATITRRFSKGGTYPLRVSAQDGRGGIATTTITVKVEDSLIDWTQRAAGRTPNLLYDVIFAGGKFVAVGINNTVLTSPDGITWATATFPTGISLTGVAHNGSRYVVSGYRFSNTTQKGLAAYSENGVNWTTVAVDTGLAQFWGITHGAGRFVTVGDSGTIYSSVDGSSWIPSAATGITTSFRSVAYADGLFVAIGDSGRLFTSPDGVTWINRSLATTNSFNSVVYHDGGWLVRGFNVIYTSPDGIVWSRATGVNVTNTASYRMISAGGLMITGGANGSIEFAENSQTWSSVVLTTTTSASFRSVAINDRTLVAVGSGGLIYSTSTPPSSTRALSAPTLRLEADAIKVAVGRKNVLSAGGVGFVKLELYANGSKVSELTGSAGALSWTPPTIGNYLLTVRGIDASGASVVSASYPAVAALDNWRWLNPTPNGNNLLGATRTDDKWWIVGGGGSLLTLDDAGVFTPIDFPTTQQLNAIAYANGRFVIATTDLDGATKEDIGGLWTSRDGYAWTPFLTGVLDSANLNTVLYATEKWIGLGTGGTIVTSTDGINWPRAPSGISQSIYSAVFGQGLVVAVAASGRIITSPDGLTWTERTSGITTDLRVVTFANGTFVAAGAGGVIITSPNGITWTRATSGTTANLYGASFLMDAFMVGGDNGILLTSPNGAAWTTASLSGNNTGILFLASQNNSALLGGRGGEVYTASSASAWRRLFQGNAEAKQAVLYAGGRWITVGANADPITRAALVPIQTSIDGITWTRANSNPAFTSLSAVAYGQQRYVAVGPNSAIFTSSDGSTWAPGTSNVVAAFTCIAASPNLFVAATSGQAIYASTNGSTWTQRITALGSAQRAAAYGNNRFVVVGDNGSIRYSTDGSTWTLASSGVTTPLLAINYWEDVGFIALGNSGVILNSLDGLTWQIRESGVAENLGAITRTPIGFVASGGTQGTLLISLDGISWSIAALPADKTIRGLAASPTTLVAVGDSGSMIAFTFVDTTPAPVIISPPVALSAILGETLTLKVAAKNTTGAVYQWFKDGTPIAGAYSPVYTISALNLTHLGNYAVQITNANGTTTSETAAVAFPNLADPGRLINLSILTTLSSAADNFTFGVIVGGAGTSGGKALLVRAAGPALIPLGITGVLADPKLEFFTGSNKVGENDNWGGTIAITNAMGQVGAFPFSSPASRDAAIYLPNLSSGDNSAKISGTGAGIVIAELYDATPSTAFTSSTPRLINVSVLKQLGTGVTIGFVIGGSSSRAVLIRAIGPSLGNFGVPDVVGDPQLTLFRGPTQVGANDNWGGTTQLNQAFNQVGAFPLLSNSKDAAILVALAPDAYTVQVSGVGATTGAALIEVYEIP